MILIGQLVYQEGHNLADKWDQMVNILGHQLMLQWEVVHLGK
jgi:hypothetical protein